MDADQVRGLAIVGVAEARTLGTIEHVYLDPQRRQIVGFGVLAREDASESLPGALDPTGAAFTPAPQAAAFLPTAAVRSLGADAVMVADASALVASPLSAEGVELIALDALDGLDVVDARGESIGRLASASFDPASFALTGIEVAQGLLRRRSHLPASLLTEVGTERIIANVAGRTTAQEQRRGDAGNRTVGQAMPAKTPDSPHSHPAAADAKPKNPSRKAPRPPRGERKRRRK